VEAAANSGGVEQFVRGDGSHVSHLSHREQEVALKEPGFNFEDLRGCGHGPDRDGERNGSVSTDLGSGYFSPT